MLRNWFFLLLMALVGCSAVKPPVLPQAKLDADSYLRFALKLEAAQDFPGAAENFEYAYTQYRGIGDTPGQLAARSGIARIALAQGKLPVYQTELAAMEQFVALHGADLAYLPLLLKVHKLMNDKNYAELSQIANATPNFPPEANLQLKIAKLQADSYLKQASPEQATELAKLNNRHLKQIRQGKSGSYELVSAAWYALAYYHFSNSNPGQAQGLAEKAADWDYRYGEMAAYAHSLWLMAQIAVSRKAYDNAEKYYDRAKGIFENLKDTQSIAEIEREKSKMKGE